jgi:hypothetical protein
MAPSQNCIVRLSPCVFLDPMATKILVKVDQGLWKAGSEAIMTFAVKY